MAKFIQDPNISLDRNFKKDYVLVEGFAPMKFEELGRAETIQHESTVATKGVAEPVIPQSA